MENDELKKLCASFSAPILYGFVWWVLKEAINKNIHRLYFLARDGFLLYEIAKLISQKNALDIQCQYLCCSRASLRRPTYHFINDEAYDLLLAPSFKSSLRTVLERIEASAAERQLIYVECGLTEYDEDQPLTFKMFEDVQAKLRLSPLFAQLIHEKSQAAYQPTIEYLKQKGLFAQDTVAIVDSGWSGSMQRSLRQLLGSAGYNGSICGFYFGMNSPAKESIDGEYYTYYFNKDGPFINKLFFSISLFECLLSAPHGMTISYALRQGKYVPVFGEHIPKELLALIQQQIACVLAYCSQKVEYMDFYSFNKQEMLKRTRHLTIRYMGFPRAYEAAVYGRFMFCDDVKESYHFSLASPGQVSLLKSYLISARIKRYFALNPLPTLNSCTLHWPYGIVAFLPCFKRQWYRFSILAGEILNFFRKHDL